MSVGVFQTNVREREPTRGVGPGEQCPAVQNKCMAEGLLWAWRWAHNISYNLYNQPNRVHKSLIFRPNSPLLSPSLTLPNSLFHSCYYYIRNQVSAKQQPKSALGEPALKYVCPVSGKNAPYALLTQLTSVVCQFDNCVRAPNQWAKKVKAAR